VELGESFTDYSPGPTESEVGNDPSGAGDTGVGYGSTDSFDFSSSGMGLSNDAIASIGRESNQFEGAFGPAGLNVMDFGRGSVSNISNAANYDPNFAALNMIGRGLTPDFNLRNQISFDVPNSMLPSLEGPLGKFGPKYYSPLERTIANMEPMGIMAMAGKAFTSMMNAAKSSFSDAKNALGLTGDAAGGLKDEDFTGLMGTRDDQQISGMSQQGAGIPVTDPVVTRPADFTGLMSTRTPTFDAFGNVTRDANMSRLADQFGQINAGIASVAPSQAQEVGDAMRDTFVTTTPNLNLPGFRSKPMSEAEAEEIRRRIGVN